jgi:hypothetical protein
MSLAVALTAGRILFIFGISEFVGHRSVPVESKHSSAKNRGTSDLWLKTPNGDFLENGSYDFDYISVNEMKTVTFFLNLIY